MGHSLTNTLLLTVNVAGCKTVFSAEKKFFGIGMLTVPRASFTCKEEDGKPPDALQSLIGPEGDPVLSNKPVAGFGCVVAQTMLPQESQ